MTGLPVLPDNLSARLAQYEQQAEGAFAENTRRALRSDTAVFLAWCTSRGHQLLPAAPDVVADFLRDQAADKKPATVSRYVSSIGHLHRAAGLSDPTKSNAVKLALKAVRKWSGTREAQSAPLNESALHRVTGALPELSRTLRDRRDVAMLAIARDALLRRSELVALDVADLEVATDGTGTVLVRRSKTDQDGAGAVQFVSASTVALVRDYLDHAGVTDGPMFRAIHRGGGVQGGLSPIDVSRAFKRLAGLAGLDAATVSGHSARVGMAQDLASAGVDLPGLMQAGRWKSPTMPSRYVERQSARRGAVARFYEDRES